MACERRPLSTTPVNPAATEVDVDSRRGTARCDVDSRRTETGKLADGRELPLLGRSAELEALSTLFSSIERGAAAIALVVAPSGFGKTALVDRFVETLRSTQRGVALQSRCYVHEERAYQAVDGCIDALSHYLCSLPHAQTATLLPRDAQALARLFPVLDRVAAIASAPAVRAAQEDRASLREQAATALRELTARLSDRTPLLLVLDDVQWDDEDSAWLLSSLFADPEPPALLLLATCRSDLRDQSHLLRALRSSPVATRLVHELPLSALSPADTLELTINTSAEAAKDPAIAARLAAESAGHPLFALELARWADRGGFRADAPKLSLDAAICARAGESSGAAQRLLEIVCVAGHPLKYGVASLAAGSDVDALRELIALRLISASGSGSLDVLYVYHDRVREALLPSLPRDQVRALHASLAAALAGESNPRFDLIVEHYLEAGEPARAARYARRAADRADSVLALHRLPSLLTLALTDAAETERATLYVRLAESYALLGRTADAARAYRAAAELERDPDRRWELSSMAMWQALLAQDFELGSALMSEIDPRMGLEFRSLGLRFAYGTLRYWLWRIWGPPKLKPNEGGKPSLAQQRRLTMAFRAATALFGEHANRATHFSAVALELSAKLGDTAIYATFLSMFAASGGMISGRPSRRSDRMLKLAYDLAHGQPDRGPQIMVAASEAAYATALGDYQRAKKILSSVLETPFPSTPFGAFLRIVVQKIYLTVLFWSGQIAQASSFSGRVIANARQHSGPHVELGLRALSAFRLLAQDDPEGAWQEWSLTLARYPDHWTFREAHWGFIPALYAGRSDRAELAITQARKLWLFWYGYSSPGRSFHIWSWGAVAAARLAQGEVTRRLRLRLWIASKLTHLGVASPAKALARSLDAARAFRSGQRELATRHLEGARNLFAEGGLSLYAAAASYVLAALHASEPLREQHRTYAREIFNREKIKRPERWVRALLPGVPEALYTPKER